MGLQQLKQELWTKSKDELIGIIVNQHDLVREIQEVLNNFPVDGEEHTLTLRLKRNGVLIYLREKSLDGEVI
ncbi:MAG: hypothetical protein A4E26_00068 [Methanobacterium sp. PtaU1.Bin097]|nr:MAG: hypothetical protein A4E26_00068 [Methanobacterium sp. PtaU1.Bin097]